jgi:ABC-2 type transport system ATP-binding protein
VSADAVIRTEGLVKDYGRTRALSGLDLQVRRGEIFGFLGPNGAGKSTTIRVLLDLLWPTAGWVEVFGQDPRTGGGRLRARIGYLPGELAMHGRQTAGQLLRDLARLRGGAGADRIGSLADRFGLDAVAAGVPRPCSGDPPARHDGGQVLARVERGRGRRRHRRHHPAGADG